jgi:transcriptional antiterminator/mannitol/fructose-specific phosphotransferase system IIA component (Ntr-type)
MELNQTCLELLKLLNQQEDYINISALSAQLGKTERSIRYSLDMIDEFLARRKLPLLSRKFGKGVQLTHSRETDALFQSFLAKSTPYQYKFSTNERLLYLEVCLLVGHSRYIPIGALANQLTVSYGTIATDLDDVEAWLASHQLSLTKKSRMGLSVTGEESLIRQTCLDRLSESITLTEYESYLCEKPLKSKITKVILDELFRGLDVAFFRDLPKQAEGTLNRVFSDESFGNLILFLAIMTQRHIGKAEPPALPENLQDNLLSTDEYSAAGLLVDQLAKETGITFSTGDCWQLTAQLLSSKSIQRGHSNLGRNRARSHRLEGVAKQMVSTIESLYHIDFSANRENLIERLITHMIPTIYRIRYNKKIINPIYDELLAKHKQLMEYTEEAAKPLAEYCGAPINEQEISYLALYFLAAINQQSPQVIRRPKVIVACGSGYGTAQVVASQLNKLFDVDIIGVLSGRNVSDLVEQKKQNSDYIVSTVDLPRLPSDLYIKVNPIFTHNDYEKILQFMDAKSPEETPLHYLDTAESLVEIAKRHGAAQNLDQLKYEFLSALIRSTNQSNFLEIKSQQPTLTELVLPQLIRLDVSCRDWKEVVQQGMVPLEEYRFVAPGYKDAVIRNILEYGPSMVMFPGTLISHAGPADGCKKLGFGFMSLHHPVSFNHSVHDPVRIVFTLSVVDASQHMTALSQLFRLLSDPKIRQQLFEAHNKETVLRIIQQFSGL